MKPLSEQVTSEISACKQCIALWELILENQKDDIDSHRSGYVSKSTLLAKLLGRKYFSYEDEMYMNTCPCCEFAVNCSEGGEDYADCNACPMRGFWGSDDTHEYELFEKSVYCEQDTSYYHKWYRARRAMHLETSNHYALLVLDAAKQALSYWTSMREMNTIW